MSHPDVVPSSDLERLQTVADRAGVQPRTWVLPTHGRLDLDGLSIHYLDWGGHAETTILFLHGGGLSAHTFDLVCLQLHEEYRCVALDLRGHGDSDWSDDLDYRVEHFAADVEGSIAALGLEQIVLVGNSLGGLTSLTFAASHPGVVAALVLLDVGPNVRTDGAERIVRFMRDTEVFATLDDLVERSLEFNERRDRDLLRSSLARKVKQRPDGMWTWKHDPRRYRPGVGESPQTVARLWKHVEWITCPTLVVRGEDSDVFSAEAAEELTAALPQGRLLTIPGAGHTPQGDNPRAVAEGLREFLGS